MTSRATLKERAKKGLRLNYWRTILITLILAFTVGGGGEMFGSIFGQSIGYLSMSGMLGTPSLGAALRADDFSSYLHQLNYGQRQEILYTIGFIAIFVLLILLFLYLLQLAISILFYGPLEVGARRYYLSNLEGEGRVAALGFSFDHSYLNAVKIIFLRNLFIILWSLLFVIPGIIKSYEYRMVPYLLAEHPDLTREDAFAISRYMMRGNKWRAFVLDLSFIPWQLLGIVTVGLSEVFWSAPYYNQTLAAFYEAVKDETRPFDPVVEPKSTLVESFAGTKAEEAVDAAEEPGSISAVTDDISAATDKTSVESVARTASEEDRQESDPDQ